MEVHNQKLSEKRSYFSKRELETYKMILLGKRNKEIAQQLDINEKTVSTYKLRVANKLGLKAGSCSPVLLLLAGIETGVIDKKLINELTKKVPFLVDPKIIKRRVGK